MIVSRTLRAALLAVAFSMFGTSAFAETIDHQFRADGSVLDATVATDGALLGNGWYTYLPNGTVSGNYYYGQYDPVGLYLPESRGVVAYLDTGSADDVYPVGMQKTVGVNLEASTQYNLSVAVGNPESGGVDDYNYNGFGGYIIQLLAGGAAFAEDDNTQKWVNVHDVLPGEPNEEGTFKTASLSFTTGSGSSQFVDNPEHDPLDPNSPSEIDVMGLMGLALGIRLIHKNGGPVPSPDDSDPDFFWGIAFDDVQLTISPVPVPAAVWLFGSALLGLFGFDKRRKTA